MEQIAISEGVYTFRMEHADEPIKWDGPFGYDHTLVEARIPEGATRIADQGFRFCAALERILLPESITYLGSEMLYAAHEPVEIHYAGTPRQFAALAQSRKLLERVQVPGKYDVQPFCNTDGTYYREEMTTKHFDDFCADIRVIFPDGRMLYYGFKNHDKQEENRAVLEVDAT